MRRMRIGLTLIIGVLMMLDDSHAAAAAQAEGRWALVVHGGAGVIERKQMTAAQEKAYRAAMAHVAEVGAAVLKKGGTSLDAVERVIRVLEDDPLFNAGRGAVFTAEGRNELDAAIMDGGTLKAGSVAGITHTRHPISLARAVMEKSPHVMLIGGEAEEFGQTVGLEQVPPSFFFTQKRWQALETFLKKNHLPIPPRPAGAPPPPAPHATPSESDKRAALVHDEGKHGTVGVVALDVHGNVAAGTSTGGTTGKRWGRVGDSPIIGAGTYASNSSCAVSATGTGEYFIRLTVARTICALVEYQHLPIQAAVNEVIQQKLTGLKGDGGVIALTPDGQVAWSFNTPGMYRAKVGKDIPLQVSVYGDEP